MSQNSEYSEKDIREGIDSIIKIVESSIRGRNTLGLIDTYNLMIDLKGLLDIYADINAKECGRLVISRYIGLINVLINSESSNERVIGYHDQLENAYRLAGRVSLEHFIMYYEWYEEEKLLEERYEILEGYCYYLNKMCFDSSFEGIIANLPSGYGKSRMVRFYEAFRLGVDSTGTFLSLCSNDDVIKGQSRSVIDIIKNERYGNVFPHMRYSKEDKDYFLKETDGEWKLKKCKLIASYYAASTRTNVVGIRASLSIDIDDLYADPKEAQNESLNKEYYDKFLTVWKKRYVQNKKAQVVVTGTMWSATDFLTKLIDLWEKESEFEVDPKHKYCRISKDGKRVIVQVPALDYDTDESTCPRIKSTEELHKERDTMDRYLWETNFQQRPTSPEGMPFDMTKLKVYDMLPKFDNEYSFAALDPSRKGTDFLSMPIFKKDENGYYYLVDILFSNTSVKYLYDEIVDKIISNKVMQLVVEINTDTSLKEVLESKLREKSYNGCVIYEKYSVANKEIRINDTKDLVIDKIVFPNKTRLGKNTQMYKAIDQMNTYSFNHPNKHDDMADSVSLFGDQIILGNAIPQRAVAVKRMF
jgi:predicted phage terminase large subunit-like protein